MTAPPSGHTVHPGAMTAPPSGHTVLEAVCVLSLLAILLSRAIPEAREVGDRAAVRAAREAVVGLVSGARSHAVRTGAAELVVSERTDRVLLRVRRRDGGDGETDLDARQLTALRSLNLARKFGVELEIAGAVDEALLRFDGLGLGRTASRTLSLRRGEAVATLLVSSYGRVRRR